MMNFWQRTPKAKLLGYVVSVVFAAVFLYGAVRFPDAPIHECAGGYCGKRGILHTAAEYRDFNVWQSTLLIVWAAAIGLSLLVWGRGDK
jgi:hypothetical protein